MRAAWRPGDTVRLLGAGAFGGPYTVVQVKAGGMGVVYIADRRSDGTLWALKSTPAGPTAEVAERFGREAELWVSLGRHPHIVHAHVCARFLAEDRGPHDDTGHADRTAQARRTPVIVTDFVTGGSLAERIAQGPLQEGEALRLGIQVCLAMEHFEEVTRRSGQPKVAHRDLKPANVMLTPPPLVSAKVTDFGLARAFAEAAPLTSLGVLSDTTASSVTRTGTIAGSPAYMAPEQFQEFRAADIRADIYSFGIMLFEMLSGSRPFNADSVGVFAHLHANTLPPDLNSLGLRVSPQLQGAVSTCLRKKPQERFPSFSELRLALGGQPLASSALAGAASAGRQSPAQRLAMADSLANIGRGAPDRRALRRLMEALGHVQDLLYAPQRLSPPDLAGACDRGVRWGYAVLAARRDGRGSAEEAQRVLTLLRTILLQMSPRLEPGERTRLLGTIRRTYGLVWPGGSASPRPAWLDEYLAGTGEA